jgi:periplasmic divalent cation tolerance protein
MRQVFCTCKPDEAERLATALLEERLVACVQSLQIESRYWWQGKTRRDPETLLIMKTRAGLMPQLIARIKELHSYEVPEIVALAVEEANPDYIKWLREETTT